VLDGTGGVSVGRGGGLGSGGVDQTGATRGAGSGCNGRPESSGGSSDIGVLSIIPTISHTMATRDRDLSLQ
jgi:hypothetical protein